MPSSVYIEVPIEFTTGFKHNYFTAPANGFMHSAYVVTPSSVSSVYGTAWLVTMGADRAVNLVGGLSSPSINSITLFPMVPVRCGQEVNIIYDNGTLNYCRFIYSVGEAKRLGLL